MTEDLETLSGVLNAVWARLETAPREGNAPARFVTLATMGADGPEARLVVLRHADRARHEITIYTDTASAKVGELVADPRASVLAWDPNAQLQIRLRGLASVSHGNPEAWAVLPNAARAVYGGAPLPGAPVADPTDVASGNDSDRFTVVTFAIREIEALVLGQPHRRARFSGSEQTWLAP